MHVRSPDGKPSRNLEYYKEVADRIRSSETDVIINFTTGMGGDFELGEGKDPLNPLGPNNDMIHALERLEHVEQLLPEICTLDCGSLNFGDTNMLFVHTPIQLRAAAKKIQQLGVKPEMEAFEMGHLWFANQLYKRRINRWSPYVSNLFRHTLGGARQHQRHENNGRHDSSRGNMGRFWHWKKIKCLWQHKLLFWVVMCV